MSEQQLRSYRLTSMEEPTDEMLHAIMEKVALAAGSHHAVWGGGVMTDAELFVHRP